MKKKWLIVILLVLFILLASFSLLGFTHQVRNITDKLPTAGSYGKRSLDEIKYLVIHHSASNGQTAFDYANFHISKGWPGIGYHFVIDPSGKIWKTNSLDTVSYHVQGHNKSSLGICLSGNLNDTPMTRAQQRSLKSLIRRLSNELPGNLEIKAHRDFVNTDCPGHHTDINQLLS